MIKLSNVFLADALYLSNWKKKIIVLTVMAGVDDELLVWAGVVQPESLRDLHTRCHILEWVVTCSLTLRWMAHDTRYAHLCDEIFCRS